jgi:cation transport regulator ChaB
VPRDEDDELLAREGEDLPSTLERSSRRAQLTWLKARDSAYETYDDAEAAHRVAYAALKHSFEKVGDRWVAKKRKGPSDPRAAAPTDEARAGRGETFGGVDVLGNSKAELLRRARDLDVPGRTRMSKEELARAIARKQG